MNPYSSVVCDDFGVYVYTNTKMELPTRRETVLHFFDSLKRTYPKMTEFECRESGEYVLEEDREEGSYRWAALETKRFCSGYVNPPSLEEADAYHQRILDVAPAHMDFSQLDCEALDVVYAFDLVYNGNHDEIVAEALGLHPALESLLENEHIRVLNFQPSLMLSLDETCRLQCRLNVETRTNPFMVRTNQFNEAAISVYFTIRQYWEKQPYKTFQESYLNQRKVGQEIVDNQIIPAIVQPLFQTIAAK
jgi:hypothetical protein